MQKLRENRYRQSVIDALSDYEFFLWAIPDGYMITGDGNKISTPRYVDIFGIRKGKMVALELKMGTHPVPSMFPQTEIGLLTTVEAEGGMALVGCIDHEQMVVYIYVWNAGLFGNQPIMKVGIKL